MSAPRFPIAALAAALPNYRTEALVKLANTMTPDEIEGVLRGLAAGGTVRHSKGRLALASR